MDINDPLLKILGDLREIQVLLNTQIPKMQHEVDVLKDEIHKMQQDSSHDRFVIEKMKQDYDDILKELLKLNKIESAVSLAQTNFSKLSEALESHIDISDGILEKIREEYSNIEKITGNFPYVYQKKEEPKTVMEKFKEIINLAPGIIALITFIGGIILMYLKNIN